MVAICVVLVPGAAVGAVGVPVKDGEFIVDFNAIADVLAVILAVLEATDIGNVAMVLELTPPTLFTVGKSAVPPKSLVNLSFPLVVEFASGVEEALMPDCTPESTND